MSVLAILCSQPHEIPVLPTKRVEHAERLDERLACQVFSQGGGPGSSVDVAIDGERVFVVQVAEGLDVAGLCAIDQLRTSHSGPARLRCLDPPPAWRESRSECSDPAAGPQSPHQFCDGPSGQSEQLGFPLLGVPDPVLER